MTDIISGSDTAHTARTDSMSLFDTTLLREYSQYFGFCTFIYCLNSSISGFDTAGTAGTRSNLGGYCQYWQYSGVMYCGHIIAIIGSSLFGRFYCSTLSYCEYS